MKIFFPGWDGMIRSEMLGSGWKTFKFSIEELREEKQNGEWAVARRALSHASGQRFASLR
jgi:hypothetical protein